MPEQPKPSSTNGLLIFIGIAALFAVFATEGQPMHFRDDSVTGSQIPIPPAPLPPPPREANLSPPIPGIPYYPPPAKKPQPIETSTVSPQYAPPAQQAANAETSRPAAAPSTATPEQPEARASIDKDDVQQVIHALVPQFKDCYEQAVRQNPSTPGGKVTVEFTLARDTGAGSVPKEGSIADSTLNSPLVEACILDKLRAAKFPEMKGEGTVKVRYPLNFANPQDGK